MGGRDISIIALLWETEGVTLFTPCERVKQERSFELFMAFLDIRLELPLKPRRYKGNTLIRIPLWQHNALYGSTAPS